MSSSGLICSCSRSGFSSSWFHGSCSGFIGVKTFLSDSTYGLGLPCVTQPPLSYAAIDQDRCRTKVKFIHIADLKQQG